MLCVVDIANLSLKFNLKSFLDESWGGCISNIYTLQQPRIPQDKHRWSKIEDFNENYQMN